MQASRIDTKIGWKQSVVKNIAVQSQILAETKDLPSKFTPFRSHLHSNSSNSLIKQKRNQSNSQDQINVQEKSDRSMSKGKGVQKRGSLKQKQTINANDSSLLGKNRDKSQKSVEMNREKAIIYKTQTNIVKDFDLVRELKLEFLRFKDRILKQLKKQQEDIKKAKEQIDKLISQKRYAAPVTLKESQNYFRRDQPKDYALYIASNNISPIKNKQVNSSLSNSPQVQIKRNRPVIDIQQYRLKLSPNGHGYQTSLPEIRQQVGKFYNIINQLKADIGYHSFPNESSLPQSTSLQ